MPLRQRWDTTEIADERGRILHLAENPNSKARMPTDAEAGPVEQKLASIRDGALSWMKEEILRGACDEDVKHMGPLKSVAACTQKGRAKWPAVPADRVR